MSRTTRALAAVLLAIGCWGRPARAETLPDDWLAVKPDELTATDSAIEPGADAEYDFVKAWIADTFGTELVSTQDWYVRVKVLTPGGAQRYSLYDVVVPLEHARVTDLRARVTQPDGTVLSTKRDAVAADVVVRRGRHGQRRISIAIPGLRVGSVVDVRWRETRFDEEAWVQERPFQFAIPVRLVTYHYKPMHFDGAFIDQYTFQANAPFVSSKDEPGYFVCAAFDRPSIAHEPLCPPDDQCRGWMVTYYSDHRMLAPAEYWARFAADQARLAEAATRPDKEITAKALAIVASASTDSARVRALVDWLRTNFRLVTSAEKESLDAAGLHACANARDAYRQGGGTALDIDRLLMALARGAGMPARWLRVPRRTWLFFDQNMTDPGFIDSFEVAIQIDGLWRPFDLSVPQLPWDMLPWDKEGQRALLCDADSAMFLITPVSEPERTRLTSTAELTLDSSGTLEGGVRMRCEGHYNTLVRELFADVAGDQVDSTFTRWLQWGGGENVSVDHVRLDRGERAWDPIVVTYHVRFESFAQPAGTRMILQPSALHATDRALFTASRRKLPVYFTSPWSECDSLRLHLPAGWRFETGEAAPELDAVDVGHMSLTTSVADEGRTLATSRALDFGEQGTIYFPVKEYAGLKRFFDQVHERDQQTVSLVREAKP